MLNLITLGYKEYNNNYVYESTAYEYLKYIK